MKIGSSAIVTTMAANQIYLIYQVTMVHRSGYNIA